MLSLFVRISPISQRQTNAALMTLNFIATASYLLTYLDLMTATTKVFCLLVFTDRLVVVSLRSRFHVVRKPLVLGTVGLAQCHRQHGVESLSRHLVALSRVVRAVPRPRQLRFATSTADASSAISRSTTLCSCWKPEIQLPCGDFTLSTGSSLHPLPSVPFLLSLLLHFLFPASPFLHSLPPFPLYFYSPSIFRRLPFPSPLKKTPRYGVCGKLPERGLGRSSSGNRIWCISALKSDN